MSRCDDVRAAAAEAAFDLLAGPERATVLAHLDSCAACRDEVAELSSVADALLGVAPFAEPPPGFEARVLERIGGASVVPLRRRPRRPWLAPAIAAACAAVLGLAGGLLAGAGSGADDLRTADLLAADGRAIGRLVVFEDDRMVCVFDDTRPGAGYTVEVVDEDGDAHAAGAFEAPGGEWSWTVSLPIDGDAVDSVVVRGADGEVRSTAEL